MNFKRSEKFFVYFLAAFFLLFLGILLALPRVVKHYGIRKLEESCKPCSLTWEDLDVNLFTGAYRIRNLNFLYREKDFLEITWSAADIQGELSIWKLFWQELHLEKHYVDDTQVIVVDSDGPEPTQARESPLPNFIFVLKGLEVKNGKFTYVNKTQGHLSQLQVPWVSASLGELGNTPELRTKLLTARAEGRVEKSGDVKLKIETYLFNRPPLFIDVEVQSSSHDLSDLTPFFKAYAGVSLKGIMLEGRGRVSIRGSESSASIRARYKDFEVKIDKMYDRSATAAFFMNLGKAIAFDDKNLDKKRSEQIQSIKATREKKESIPGFILRSLKEAALAVVSA